MAEGKGVREASDGMNPPVTPDVAAPIVGAEPAASLAIAEPVAPAVTPEPLAVAINEPPVVEAAAATHAPEVKLPQTPQIDPTLSPPPFLREHENRVIAARPAPAPKAPPRSRPAPPKAAPAQNKPKSRFPLLAATLALAAGLGGALGAIGVPAALHVAFGSASAASSTDTAADLQTIKTLATQLTAELGALRNVSEQSSKSASSQLGKLAERLDRAERAQSEPAAKLAKISETLDRLEKRTPTPVAAVAPAAALPAHNDITGSITPPAPAEKPKPPIIEDYIVRRVLDGVALVEGRRGIVEVEPGTSLPGAGRVEEIRRQDGRWVVVTTKGMIVPAR
jgi:hypothetical protein